MDSTQRTSTKIIECYELNICVPLNFICLEALTPSVLYLETGPLRKELRLDEVMEAGL